MQTSLFIKTLSLAILCSLTCHKGLSQTCYSIVSETPEDSIFCAKHCPFYDFSTQEELYGTTIPEQLVERKNGRMEDLVEETNNVVYTGIEDHVLYLFVVVDSVGVTRGLIVMNCTERKDEKLFLANRAFEYLKGIEFIPARLRGIAIPYGFSLAIGIRRNSNQDTIPQSKPSTREVFGQGPKHLPYYEGGYDKMYEFLFSNIDLSGIDSSAYDGRRIFVGFIIDTLGNTHDHRIMKGSAGQRCDEALIEACKLLHFHPAIGYDDKPQSCEFSIPFRFGQEQDSESNCFFRRLFKKKSPRTKCATETTI